jgi:hypothetical protein
MQHSFLKNKDVHTTQEQYQYVQKAAMAGSPAPDNYNVSAFNPPQLLLYFLVCRCI